MLAAIKARIQGLALSGAVALAGLEIISPFFFLDTIMDVLIIGLLVMAQKLK
jgi:hypothetical protein